MNTTMGLIKKKNELVAKIGFRLEVFGNKVCVYDGYNLVLDNAEMRDYDDFEEEYLYSGNECAEFCGHFYTIDETHYIFWRDAETMENFITEDRW